MISKMNKLSFLIYHKEYEMFLEKLRELGVVHIEKREGAERDAHLQAFMQKRTAYQSLLKSMTLPSSSRTGRRKRSRNRSADMLRQMPGYAVRCISSL